jgi:DNA-directed RNA polymerase sigma subunit (sigma70/sigma32)
MTPDNSTTNKPQAMYCEKGSHLHNELDNHEQAVRDMQQQMREIAGVDDPIASRVPRSLHDTLKQHMQARALSRLQWTRHVEKCWDCTLASNPTRTNRHSNLAA